MLNSVMLFNIRESRNKVYIMENCNYSANAPSNEFSSINVSLTGPTVPVSEK